MTAAAEDLARETIGKLLREFDSIPPQLGKSYIDRMVEDVVELKNNELLLAFQNEVSTFVHEATERRNLLTSFAIEICAQFYSVSWTACVEEWKAFLRATFFVFEAEQHVHLLSVAFLNTWKTAVEKGIVKQLMLEDRLFTCAAEVYTSRITHKWKYKRSAILDLIRLLIQKLKETTSSETISAFVDFVGCEYAAEELREGDFAGVTQLLVENEALLSKSVCKRIGKYLKGLERISENGVKLLCALVLSKKVKPVFYESKDSTARVQDSIYVERVKKGNEVALKLIIGRCNSMDKFAEALDAKEQFLERSPELSKEIHGACVRRLSTYTNMKPKEKEALFLACRKHCEGSEVARGILREHAHFFMEHSDTLKKFLKANQDRQPLNRKGDFAPLLKISEAALEDSDVGNAIQTLQAIAEADPNVDLIEDSIKERVIQIALSSAFDTLTRVTAVLMLAVCGMQKLVDHLPELMETFDLRPILLKALADHLPDHFDEALKHYVDFHDAGDEGMAEPLNVLFKRLKQCEGREVPEGMEPPTLTFVKLTKNGVFADLQYVRKQLALDPSEIKPTDCHGD
ncbi:hypothetical protein L596_013267 [Steinernema carpocapsae]|uniref:Uncharacterized protein n=1 Tax=Steinernema carpocapsae TaxID=34508 RepID=A0A4U5P0A8_STECR|nr:hypothetical protein L596_013267 [Steinernema carpocapsae]